MYEEPQFSFMPDIGDNQNMGTDGQVYERLYAEGMQRKEAQMYRTEEEAKKHRFRPNNSNAYDAECWSRLYQDGLVTKEKLDRRRKELVSESFTFKPQVTPFATKLPGTSIFDKLYTEAKEKKQNEIRRRKEAAAAQRQVFRFKPQITSNVGPRGEGVYQELYKDAMQKKVRNEELRQRLAAEAAEAAEKAELEPPRSKLLPPMPEPTEDWPATFMPKTNDNRGIAPRYLEPRRTYEPVMPAYYQPDPQFGGRQPWISPLEASAMEAAMRDQIRGRRSRSAAADGRAEVEYTSDVLDRLPEQHVGSHGLRLVRGSRSASGRRTIRAKSAETYMRGTFSSEMRSPQMGAADGSSPGLSGSRFRYIPKNGDGVQHIYQSARVLDFDREDAYDGGRPYINSVSGLKTYAHLAEEGVLDGTESPPRSARLLGRGETAPVTTVSRTVNQSTKVIDLTGH